MPLTASGDLIWTNGLGGTGNDGGRWRECGRGRRRRDAQEAATEQDKDNQQRQESAREKGYHDLYVAFASGFGFVPVALIACHDILPVQQLPTP